MRRYIQNHPGCIALKKLGYTRNFCGEWVLRQGGARQVPRAERWTDTERAKRRAAADPVYRRARRAEYQRIATLSAARYSPERADATTQAVRDARAIGIEIEQKIDRNIIPIEVSARDLPYAMIGKDATLDATLGTPRRDRTEGLTEWDRKGRPHYTRCSDDNWVLSSAVIMRGGAALDYYFQTPGGAREKYHWAAPEGCRWNRDEHGLRLVRGGDDYHPSSAELRETSAPASILQKLVANAEQRRKIAAERAVERAEAEGVWVCFADSLRGGNCAAGTASWAEKQGLDIHQHVPATALFERANGDWQRVRLAIRAAMTRHQREMRQGYADLAEHAVA